MNDRDELIEQLIKEKGGTKQQYLSLLNKVAYHESAGTNDPRLKQYGGGPGRGVYQFETGTNEGAITAARRTKTYYKRLNKAVPEWLNKASSGDDLDVSTLSRNQQDALFLGNMREHPTADLGKVMDGSQSAGEFWAKNHWAGADRDKKERLASFNDSISRLDTKENNQLKKNSNQELAQQIIQQDNIPQVQPLKTQPTMVQPPTADPNNFERMGPQEAPMFQDYNGDIMATINNRGQRNQGNLLAFDGGGTHQQNPQGGIPQGQGPNGQPNKVEEGETAFEFGDDKFIFSDRVSITDYIKNKKFKI